MKHEDRIAVAIPFYSKWLKSILTFMLQKVLFADLRFRSIHTTVAGACHWAVVWLNRVGWTFVIMTSAMIQFAMREKGERRRTTRLQV